LRGKINLSAASGEKFVRGEWNAAKYANHADGNYPEGIDSFSPVLPMKMASPGFAENRFIPVSNLCKSAGKQWDRLPACPVPLQNQP